MHGSIYDTIHFFCSDKRYNINYGFLHYDKDEEAAATGDKGFEDRKGETIHFVKKFYTDLSYRDL